MIIIWRLTNGLQVIIYRILNNLIKSTYQSRDLVRLSDKIRSGSVRNSTRVSLSEIKHLNNEELFF